MSIGVKIITIGKDKQEQGARVGNAKELVDLLESIAGKLPDELKQELLGQCEKCQEPCFSKEEAAGGLTSRGATHILTPEQLSGIRILMEFLDENESTIIGLDENESGSQAKNRLQALAVAAGYEKPAEISPGLKRLARYQLLYSFFLKELNEIKKEEVNGRA